MAPDMHTSAQVRVAGRGSGHKGFFKSPNRHNLFGSETRDDERCRRFSEAPQAFRLAFERINGLNMEHSMALFQVDGRPADRSFTQSAWFTASFNLSCCLPDFLSHCTLLFSSRSAGQDILSSPIPGDIVLRIMRPALVLVLAGTALTAFAAPALQQRAPNGTSSSNDTSIKLWGVNESGPEFGETNIPGTPETDYTWPNLTTIDTFLNAGMNTFRINILMERLVPGDMTASCDSAYLGNLSETVDYITRRSAYAMIVPHNYGRFDGEIITSTSDFKAFWKTVATEFKDNERVIFDTNNEVRSWTSMLLVKL